MSYSIRVLAIAVFYCFLHASCKKLDNKAGLSSDATTESFDDQINVVVKSPAHQDFTEFYYAISEGKPLRESLLKLKIISAIVPTIRILTPQIFRAGQSSDVSDGAGSIEGRVPYYAVIIGNQAFVFDADQGSYSFSRPSADGRLFSLKTVCPLTIGQTYDSEESKISDCINTRIEEPIQISQFNQLIGNAEFAANLIPGFSGADAAYNATNTNDQILGVLESTASLASLGIGASLKVISKTAATIVITASSAIVSKNVYDAVTNQPGSQSPGKYAASLLALTEAGFAVLHLYPIKILPRKFAVSSIEAAEYARNKGITNRSADEILRTGLTEEELIALVGEKVARNAINSQKRFFGFFRNRQAFIDATVDKFKSLFKTDIASGRNSVIVGDFHLNLDNSGNFIQDDTAFRNYTDFLTWLSQNREAYRNGNVIIGGDLIDSKAFRQGIDPKIIYEKQVQILKEIGDSSGKSRNDILALLGNHDAARDKTTKTVERPTLDTVRAAWDPHVTVVETDFNAFKVAPIGSNTSGVLTARIGHRPQQTGPSVRKVLPNAAETNRLPDNPTPLDGAPVQVSFDVHQQGIIYGADVLKESKRDVVFLFAPTLGGGVGENGKRGFMLLNHETLNPYLIVKNTNQSSFFLDLDNSSRGIIGDGLGVEGLDFIANSYKGPR